MTELKIDRMPDCPCTGDKLAGLVGTYINGSIVSSILPLDGWQKYTKRCKTERSGKALKNLFRTRNKGYFAERFTWNDHLDDIYEINMSKEVRCGGPMREGYKKPPESLKKSICYPAPKDECIYHWAAAWGVFDSNDRLRGYVVLVRCGDIALYSQILGHGDYMKDDIMPFLHFAIVEEVASLKGLKYLMYGGHYNGRGDGLREWKERLLFEPRSLVE